MGPRVIQETIKLSSTVIVNKAKSTIAATYFIFTLVVVGISGADDQDKFVLRVGDERISVAEFQRRAQEMMKTGFRHLDIADPEAKNIFLDGIIAHELLSHEGMRRGLDSDTTVAEEVQRTHDQAVRTKLYEVAALTGDYSSTEEELREFFVERQFDTEVFSQHIVCATEKEAWEVLERLGNGETFEELFPLYSVPHIQKRFAPEGWVDWVKTGALLPTLIEPFDSMGPGDLYPSPVQTSSGFHVFKLKVRRPVDFNENRDWLERRLRELKRGADMEVYVKDLRRRYQLKRNEEGMRTLQGLTSETKDWPDEGPVLFRWQDGQLTLGDYLNHHRLGRVKHPAALDSARLHKAADGLAGREIMLVEGRKLQLDQDSQVKTKTKNRRDELLIQWLYRQEGRAVAQEQGVTEEEIRGFYDANQDMFTLEDGSLASFELVHDSIKGALFSHIENNAMDRLISRLRKEYVGEVEVYPAGLARVVLTRPLPPQMPGKETRPAAAANAE